MEQKDFNFEELARIIEEKNIQHLREVFEEHNIVDLALMVEELSIEEAVYVFRVLTKEYSGELFSYLSLEHQERLIEILTGSEIKGILDNLYTDDLADFVEEMPEEIVTKILKSVSAQQRKEINMLLSYKENSCGSIMTTNYVKLDENLTVAQAMEVIKKQREIAESISYCYMIDQKNKLHGAMSMRDILFAPKNSLLKDVMEEDIIYVKTTDDQEEAIHEMQKYDFSMIPVVDESQKLVGVITSDDVLDVLEDEATEDIHKMAGINPIEEPYLKTNSFKIAMSRLPWLLILMLSATISGAILTANEDILMMLPALSIFVPMLMDTAGNAGSQASAMVIRGIVVDNLGMKDFFKILYKEFRIALLCGVVLFLVNMIRIILFMSDISFMMAFVSSLTILIVLVCAKLVGGLLPILATYLKLDPAVLASPLINTIVDGVSLTVYFALVKLLLL